LSKRWTAPCARPADADEEETMAFQLFSSAFPEGGLVPRLHTGDGADLSPALEWSGEPQGVKSFALIVDDPDAPAGVWNHWLLWDIPASVHSLSQGAKTGQIGRAGVNDFGNPGYGGPAPPKGHGPHRYFFKICALDLERLPLDAGARRAQLDRALKGHILSQAQTMGRYERR
jgi:Raf kinase inhibitor-like YbhB/YbcL family protein